MNTHTTPQEGQVLEEVLHVEIEIEERVEAFTVPATGEVAVIEVIRAKLELHPEVHLFEHGHDEPFEDHHARGRKHIRLVGHRCHQVTLEVRYDHKTESHHFRPSATVMRALHWAVTKYKLDPMQAAKANLILPGADQPLPKSDALGKYVKEGHCTLVMDLTLKDFSNG